MANCYSESYGVLYATKVTPVLVALFGKGNISEDPVVGVKVAVIQMSEEAKSVSWALICTNIAAYLGASCDPEDSLIAHLKCLARACQIEVDPQVWADIEKVKDVDDWVSMELLFRVVSALNDGHGATKLKVETALHGDKIREGYFGGGAEYVSSNVVVSSYSRQFIHFCDLLDAATAIGDVEKVLQVIAEQAVNSIRGIRDDSLRVAIEHKLASLLS